MEGVSPSRRAWCVGKNKENCITYYLLIYIHSKWASFIAFYRVTIVQEHAFSWPTKTIIHFRRCGPTNVILSLSYLYFSHQSEKKIVGTCGGLTNHPYVGKSTRDTPLITRGNDEFSRHRSAGALATKQVNVFL